MGGISDEAIRDRAYLIWEREGRPHGRDYEHWVQAQIELAAESRRNGSARPAPPARKAAPKAKTAAVKKRAAKAPAKTPRAAAGRTAKAKRQA